jgi:glycosyltransferase involved in cell wall biosynthesis
MVKRRPAFRTPSTEEAFPASVRASRRKVVYVDHCADLSGGQIALCRLVEALTGVDPHVILAVDGPLRQRLEDAGIQVEVLALDERARNTSRLLIAPSVHTVQLAWTVLRYSWRLHGRLRAIQPDLVHTNSLKSAVYGSIAARMAGIPVVCHLRDRLAGDYMSGSAMRLMRGVLRVLPHAVIANSLATMSTLAPQTSAVRISGAVAYDPIPAGSDPPSTAPGAPFTVGMVGRLAAWKGQDVFLRAFARAFPDGSARAVVLGSAMFDEGDYPQQLERLVDGLGLREMVDMPGFVEDVRAHLCQFDVLVHASVIPEPFGQVVVEGMAAGRPVVASDAGGPSEVITNGVNGLLVPAGDVEALAEALLRLRDSPDTRAALGAAARVKAAEFTPEGVARQVSAVYDALLAHPRGALEKFPPYS